MRRIHGRTTLAAVAALALEGALAVPAAGQPGGGLAVGEGESGSASVRLAGPQVTVTLRRALAPSRPRVGVTVTCGDLIVPGDGASSDTDVWGVVASGRTRVRGAQRRFSLRLDRGVAAQATRCDVRSALVVGDENAVEAPMRMVRGSTNLIVQTTDLASPSRPQTAPFTAVRTVMPYAGPEAFGQLAVSTAGVVAWVLRLGTDTLQVRALDGTVHTLDTGAIADPAFSADGGALTWLSAGQPRSAPLP